MQITLKAARVNAGLTQEAAAKVTGFSRSTLFRWERGDTSPSMNKLARLCEVYRVNMADIQAEK